MLAARWKKNKLKDVAEFQGGSQPPKKDFVFKKRNGYLRFLQIRDFTSNKFISYIPESSKNRLCDSEDILIGRYGASVGKILTGKQGAYNVALIKATPDEDIVDRRFFYYYLLSDKFQNSLKHTAERAAQNGFSKDDIANFVVPLPALEEQKKIVQKLDLLFEKIDAVCNLINSNIATLDLLLDSKKESIFHDISTHSKLSTFEQISAEIRYGYTAKAKDHGNVALIRITDMKDDGTFNSDRVFVDVTDSDFHRFGLEKNDILVARSGATAGKVALFNLEIDAVFASYIIRIRPLCDVVDPSYLFMFCQSPMYWNQLDKIKVGGAQPNVNATNLKKIEIPIPSIAEQGRVVSELKQIVANIDEQKLILLDQLSGLHELKNSLLDYAFQGKLVTAKVKQKMKQGQTFGLLQSIAAIVEAYGQTRYRFGEMVTAKYAFLLQHVMNVPLGIQFQNQSFGPYDSRIKKAVYAGIKQNYFAKDVHGGLLLGDNAGRLLDPKYGLVSSARQGMQQLAKHLKNTDGHKVELLATVCKSILDTGSTDFYSIKNHFENWETPKQKEFKTKANKFSDDEIKRCISFILKEKWDKRILYEK